jgi:hypothetical protein
LPNRCKRPQVFVWKTSIRRRWAVERAERQNSNLFSSFLTNGKLTKVYRIFLSFFFWFQVFLLTILRTSKTNQCLQPYRNSTRNPGFFRKPNPNLTRNFKTQTQPKAEFENLTQPKKNRVNFGLFFKENFSNFSQIFRKISTKNFFFQIYLSKILILSLQHRAAWSNHGRPLNIFMISGASGPIHGFPYSTKTFGYRMPVLGPA